MAEKSKLAVKEKSKLMELDLKELYPHESEYSLLVMPTDTEEDRLALESSFHFHVSAADEAKRPLARLWFENIAFLMGNHYLQFKWQGNTVDPINPTLTHATIDQYTPKVVNNLLHDAVESNVSVLNQDRPYPEITPNSSRPEDELSAKISEVALNLLWEKPLNIDDILTRSAYDLCAIGTSFVEIDYGPTSYPVEVDDTDEKEVKDKLTGEKVTQKVPNGKTKVMFQEDLQAKAFNSFHVIVNPSATDDPESLLWICRTTFEDMGWIQENFNRDEPGFYPENLDRIRNDNVSDWSLYWYARINDLIEVPHSMLNQFGLTNSREKNGSSSALNQTVFSVVDVRPSLQFPRGRTLVFAGGALIYQGNARAWTKKYNRRWNPYAIGRYWRIPGRFWGEGLLSELIPMLKRINVIDALVQVNREFMVFGQWLIPTRSLIKTGLINHFPGEQVEYRPGAGGAKPERIQNVPLPAELMIERNLMERAIKEMAGTIKTSEGGPSPSGLRSGVMLDLLQREQMLNRSNMLQNREDFVKNIAQSILITAANKLKDPTSDLLQRLRFAARDFSPVDIGIFAVSNLQDNIQVKIDIRSALMKSPEAKKQAAMEALQALGPYASIQERTIMLKVAGLEEFEHQHSPSMERIRTIISRLAQGIVPAALVANPTKLMIPGVEDPGVCADELRDVILSRPYETYPADTKLAMMKLFDAYREAANQMLQQSAMIQGNLSAAGAMPGKPPGKKGGVMLPGQPHAENLAQPEIPQAPSTPGPMNSMGPGGMPGGPS